MAVFGVVGSILQTMLSGIRTVGSTLGALPFRFRFALFWLLGVLFLLFNAETVYGASAQTQRFALILYVCAIGFVFSLGGVRNPLLGMSTAEFMITFLLAFAAGVVALRTFAPFTPAETPIFSRENVGLALTHALVVAIGEELLFRIAVPSMIPGPPMAGQTLSAAAFAVMHYSAYGGSVPNMVVAGFLGLFFGALVVKLPRIGFVIACALHASFNLFVLGFL